MRIVIVGGGVVGQNLAEELVVEDHDVTVIDRTPAVVEALSERLDVFALCGDGGSACVYRLDGTCELQIATGGARVDVKNLGGGARKCSGPRARVQPCFAGISIVVQAQDYVSHFITGKVGKHHGVGWAL